LFCFVKSKISFVFAKFRLVSFRFADIKSVSFRKINIFPFRNSHLIPVLRSRIIFNAAPTPGKNFDAAPAPTPILLYRKTKILKRTIVLTILFIRFCTIYIAENSVVEPEPQGAASFGRSRSRNTMRIGSDGSGNAINKVRN
jgi:hypothetical protein